ncbi:unnamed protein product [Paramecium octaurelia]|uniref:Uncharacterized protein n=1 Tax=Paramecium octaurelia TaxID=43137 RepID=A0A8S1S9A7_PAROT|nr:unnamed protein product [Paramecium octaurelia]
MNIDGLETIVNFLNQEVKQLLIEQRTQSIAQTHITSHQNLKRTHDNICLVETCLKGQHNPKCQIELSIKEYAKYYKRTAWLIGFQILKQNNTSTFLMIYQTQRDKAEKLNILNFK